MKTINVVNGPQNVSAIVQGCMRMAPLSIDEATKVIRNAYDLGVTFFDHATCYTNGECEQRFGDAFPQDRHQARGHHPSEQGRPVL